MDEVVVAEVCGHTDGYGSTFWGGEPARCLVCGIEALTLDGAWREAEAALPEGWAIAMLWGTVTSERWGASACPWPAAPNREHEFGGGDTPAAALRQLAGRLAERDRTTGRLTTDQLLARSAALKEPLS